MKTGILRSITLLLCTVLALAVTAARPGVKTNVSFNELSHDFGNISASIPSVSTTFEITNNGDAAVAILSAKASCGCTEPDYQRKPIMPGETGTVKVTFLTRGYSGEFDKEVTVRLRSASGKSERVQFVIKGVIIPPTQ